MFETYPFRSLSRSLVLPCTMLLSAAALSQTGGQGAITGSVLDLTGAAIPNASIIAVNKATGVQTRRTASDDGVYALTPLLPGTYTVTVTANGFSTFSQQNIVVDALGSVGLNVTLKTGSASEVVNVSSAPPVLETTNAALGGVIENDVYAALPLLISGGQQRDITQFSNLLPGAQVNPGGRSSIIGGTGQRVGELYLDGLPLTTLSLQGDNRPIFNIVPLEAIDQIRVVTSGFSAEYQGAGLENYNLKSGGNQYHGSLFAYVRKRGADAGKWCPGEPAWVEAGRAPVRGWIRRWRPGEDSIPLQRARQALLLQRVRQVPFAAGGKPGSSIDCEPGGTSG
jgi:hypothetical protein